MVGLYLTPGEPTMKIAKRILTLEEADELILAACTQADGAIEDCEVEPHQVNYFFETGSVGTVHRISGRVAIQADPGA